MEEKKEPRNRSHLKLVHSQSENDAQQGKIEKAFGLLTTNIEEKPLLDHEKLGHFARMLVDKHGKDRLIAQAENAFVKLYTVNDLVKALSYGFYVHDTPNALDRGYEYALAKRYLEKREEEATEK